MICSLIQPNLWVGPTPRTDEDFAHLKSLEITAILSLQDEQDRDYAGIESERVAAARANVVFESVPVKDFNNEELKLRLPECVTVLERLLHQGHSVYVHCHAGISHCDCCLSLLVYRMGTGRGVITCQAVPPLLPDCGRYPRSLLALKHFGAIREKGVMGAMVMVIKEGPLDLSTVVTEMKPRLREMIGANIALQMNLERERLLVKADARLIEQVVLNLISNARDATPDGGTITVETSRRNVGQDFVRPKVGGFSEAEWRMTPEGSYIRLVVRDTGIGMDAYTKREAFNPFFTTKAVGKGQGLGLSVVYGIVKPSGGWISLDSELGRGARFEIYLPEVPAPVGH